jgi:hypothetical protein
VVYSFWGVVYSYGVWYGVWFILMGCGILVCGDLGVLAPYPLLILGPPMVIEGGRVPLYCVLMVFTACPQYFFVVVFVLVPHV